MARFLIGLVALFAATTATSTPQGPTLEVTLIGNAGVLLSDGTHSVMVDLPYESGASGYQRYSETALSPSGEVLSVVTHGHRDHLASELLYDREGWRLMAAPGVAPDLPDDRRIAGERASFGAFSVTAIATPHSAGHRSYVVRWRDRALFFSGDTEEPRALSSLPPLDLLFITPWLSCAVEESRVSVEATRRIAYHLDPTGGDRICLDAESLPQGSVIVMGPGAA